MYVTNPAPKGRTLTFWCIISAELYSQNFGSLYPITKLFQTCTFPNPAPKEILQLTYIYPNFWHDISNTNIYILLYLYLYSYLRNTCQLYLYIGVGYIIPTIGEMCQLEGFCAPGNVHFVMYIFVLDICCQHLGNIRQLKGFCAPFGRKVKECTLFNIYIYI